MVTLLVSFFGDKSINSGAFMGEGIAMTIAQQFEMERISRVIDSTADPEQLQLLAKQLLQAWHSQKAATEWVIRQQMEGYGL